jgi:hypothetical protein
MTFIDRPSLRFTALTAEGCMRPSEERNRLAFDAAVRAEEPMQGSERLAFDLYSGSFFQPSADARLLMLTMSVETLLDLQPRSDEARHHVQTMIEATNINANLSQPERDSIRGSLTWLLDESIGQAGRRLVRALDPRRYGGKSPVALFTRCYETRSALVHGHMPRPDRDEVDFLAAQLEVLVSDLLAGGLLGVVPD